jgi:signal transduction histidine kinase
VVEGLPHDDDPEQAESSASDTRAREQAAYRYLINQKCAPYISELTLGLLHRFNNVFTGIIFLTDDCLAHAEGDEPMTERLNEIANVLRIAHTFVDRVVHLHVDEAGDDVSYYDVDALIANDLETLALLLPKGAAIHHTPAREPLCFYGSKQAFREILLHVIENAGGALTKAGGSVWISAQVQEGGGDPPRAVLSIRDNGDGFAPDVLPKIFEPLFTTKADQGRAGLGLFRARQLARSIKGDLRARNHPEGGAELTLTLTQTNPESGS